MRNTITAIIIILTGISIKSQIIIGDNNPQFLSADSKALLSFSSENMGIILPIINSATESATTNNVVRTPGTMYVSRADRSIKVYAFPSTQDPTGILSLTPSLPAAVVLPTASSETESDQDTGVIMGAVSTTQKGILVLEHEAKTLILPLIGTVTQPPHKFVKSPYIGTIGFAETENAVFPTTKPNKKLLWVFNGGDNSISGAGQWHLWRAGVEMPPTEVIDQSYLDNLP